jgi:hypothetical protein
MAHAQYAATEQNFVGKSRVQLGYVHVSCSCKLLAAVLSTSNALFIAFLCTHVTLTSAQRKSKITTYTNNRNITANIIKPCNEVTEDKYPGVPVMRFTTRAEMHSSVSIRTIQCTEYVQGEAEKSDGARRCSGCCDNHALCGNVTQLL